MCPVSVDVTPAPLTVTAPSPALTYGGTVPAVTATYSGFIGDDSASSLTTAAKCSTTATSSSSPGTYPVTCSGAVDPNYLISYAAGTVTVSPAPLTVVSSSTTFTYGGAVPGITPSYAGFVDSDNAASLTTAPECSTTATSSSPPGTYPATCSGASDPDYTVNYVAGVATVKPAPLTVAASSASFTYAGAVPTIVPSYVGFVGGDSAQSLSTAPKCSTTATTLSPPGTYPATCVGAIDANYTISYVGRNGDRKHDLLGRLHHHDYARHDYARHDYARHDYAQHDDSYHCNGTSQGLPRGRGHLPQRGHSHLWRPGLRLRRREGLYGHRELAQGSGKGRPRQASQRPSRGRPPHGGAPRPGTLLTTNAVTGNGTIYVSGTDGELHGFSTLGQFFRDGYDAALVVTVPSLDGLSDRVYRRRGRGGRECAGHAGRWGAGRLGRQVLRLCRRAGPLPSAAKPSSAGSRRRTRPK